MSPVEDPWAALILDDVDLPTMETGQRGWSIDDASSWNATTPDRAGGSSMSSGNDRIAVIGATGGAGATTVACGVALAYAAQGSTAVLIDGDLEFGDTHEAWDVPRHRTLGDLITVLDELGPHHVELVGYHHASGVELCLAPAERGAADAWRETDVAALLGAASSRGPVVVDCGRASPRHVDAVCDAAHSLIVVSPPTLRGAQRVAAIIARLDDGSGARIVINRTRVARPELSVRAFAAACGHDVECALPTSEREAEHLRSGIWRPRRRGLSHRIQAIVGMGRHGTR